MKKVIILFVLMFAVVSTSFSKSTNGLGLQGSIGSCNVVNGDDEGFGSNYHLVSVGFIMLI